MNKNMLDVYGVDASKMKGTPLTSPKFPTMVSGLILPELFRRFRIKQRGKGMSVSERATKKKLDTLMNSIFFKLRTGRLRGSGIKELIKDFGKGFIKGFMKVMNVALPIDRSIEDCGSLTSKTLRLNLVPFSILYDINLLSE